MSQKLSLPQLPQTVQLALTGGGGPKAKYGQIRRCSLKLPFRFAIRAAGFTHAACDKRDWRLVRSARMIAPPRSRCELIGGNFLECVPHGANAYIMKRILMG
jgi:hypothetical protein